MAATTVDTFKVRQAHTFANGLQPWRQAGISETVNPVPSMIMADEAKFLHWICRDLVKGMGHIIDMGPLAGGSTYCMASGLASNPAVARGKVCIHSYDLWTFYPDHQRFFETPLRQGDSVLPFWKENVAEFLDFVEPHEGDILTYEWSAGPIELMFIDAAKTEEVNTHIVNKFFPHLIPGVSYILQQDMICSAVPWLHYTMEFFRDNFTLMDSPGGGTVVYRYEKEITPSQLREFNGLVHDLKRKEALMAVAAKRFTGFYALVVALSSATFLYSTGKVRLADQIVEKVKRDAAYEPEVDFDINMLKELRQSVVSSQKERQTMSRVKRRLRSIFSELIR